MINKQFQKRLKKENTQYPFKNEWQEQKYRNEHLERLKSMPYNKDIGDGCVCGCPKGWHETASCGAAFDCVVCACTQFQNVDGSEHKCFASEFTNKVMKELEKTKHPN